MCNRSVDYRHSGNVAYAFFDEENKMLFEIQMKKANAKDLMEYIMKNARPNFGEEKMRRKMDNSLVMEKILEKNPNVKVVECLEGYFV